MRKRRQGLSFVEILIGTLILSVVALGLFQTMRTGYMGTKRVTRESQATHAATALLEALVALPFDDLPCVDAETSSQELATLIPERAQFQPPEPPDEGMVPTVEIRDASHGWGPLKLIRVTVNWLSRHKKPAVPRTLVFQTLVTNDGEVWR